MRAKDTCPSCGAKVSPDDLLCANCELILDANLIPDQPSNGDFSVVRRMLEVPQPGLPSQRPARPPAPASSSKGNEGPTRVFALGRTRGIPMVVASLTKRAAALSELEAFVVSFIDGESDLDTLAERSGIRSFEMGVVLQALNDKMIVDFADESLQEEEDEAPPDEPPTEALPKVDEPRSSPTVLMAKPVELGPPPTIRMEPIRLETSGPPATIRMEPIRLEAPRTAPTELLEPVRLPEPPPTIEVAAETGDVTPPGAADPSPTPPPPMAQTLEPAPTPPPAAPAEPPAASLPDPAPTPPPPAPLPPPVEARRRSMKLRPSLPGLQPGEKPPPPVPTPPAPEGRAPTATPPAPATPPPGAPPPPPRTPPAAVVRPPAIAPLPPRRTIETRQEPSIDQATLGAEGRGVSRTPVETRQEPAVDLRGGADQRKGVETRQEPAVDLRGGTDQRKGVETRQEPAIEAPRKNLAETRQEPAVEAPRNVETRQEPAIELRGAETRQEPPPAEPSVGAEEPGVIIDASLDESASSRHRPSSSWVLTSVTASTRPELRLEPSIIVAPHATPPEVPEVPRSPAPPPSRPRRTLPAGSRATGSRPAPPLKLDSAPAQGSTRGVVQTQVTPAETPAIAPVQTRLPPVAPPAAKQAPAQPAPAAAAPKPMPPKTQPVELSAPPKPMPPKTQPVELGSADAPSDSTDPRIINRGRVNRKVLDALKQVKRRDTAPETSPSEPSVDEILADKLAAGSLQVAIRMEQNGRLDEAIRYLENSIAKSPDAPSLYNRLAIILMRERADLRRAEQLLQKATELAPGHEVYEKNLAAVLSKRAMKK